MKAGAVGGEMMVAAAPGADCRIQPIEATTECQVGIFLML